MFQVLMCLVVLEHIFHTMFVIQEVFFLQIHPDSHFQFVVMYQYIYILDAVSAGNLCIINNVNISIILPLYNMWNVKEF
jgi:hypothetical protein